MRRWGADVTSYGAAAQTPDLILSRRASRNPRLVSGRIQAENPQHELEGQGTALAQPARGGEARDSLAQDSAEHGGEHGVRTGAGESFDAANRARTQAYACLLYTSP